ncbi:MULTISPECIES: FkbM family methyltransferase [unclassified Mesorhizobium]|nr:MULTISPECIES: FkbM family methyltransferase [unclassified Mesorhizobium]
MTLDTVMKQTDIREFDLLKIDLEGYELPVLKEGVQGSALKTRQRDS